MAPVSGHVYRWEGKRRPVWRAKYRLPDGRQVKKTIGPAWTQRGRPRPGYYTKRTAEAWLRDMLDQARAGVLPGMTRTGVTFADACEEWLRYMEHDLDRKPSTLVQYRSSVRAHFVPAFGHLRLEDVSAERIEAWKATLRMNNRTKIKLLVELNGVFVRARRAYKLPHNPMADVEKPRARSSSAIEVFAPEEVWALVRAADSEQDAAIFLTAAFTGLRRGELVALRWRDIAFTAQRVRVCGSFAGARLTSPKSGKVRLVPMAPDVARALARLAARGYWTGDDDLVFPGVTGSYLDASALARRYKAALKRAALRPLRFHDLRHTFGTRMIAKADIRRVQEWMGHADVATTMKYLHYVERPDEAELVAAAFALESPASGLAAPAHTTDTVDFSPP
ncbi:MAG TPA: tyrosine-type recombinase/integrase [Solirubrobacteraceae bacterium]|nr:tyrosine-type recombinase/integrase [Solirubrobacteraceae bacterium]